MKNEPFKIYRESKLDWWATNRPKIMRLTYILGLRIDFLFENGTWPNADQIEAYAASKSLKIM